MFIRLMRTNQIRIYSQSVKFPHYRFKKVLLGEYKNKFTIAKWKFQLIIDNSFALLGSEATTPPPLAGGGYLMPKSQILELRQE